jgi:hypothetical protein
LVPASDSGPHMAKLGEDLYYKRSGDRFVRMEHFDIEDMFGRRRKPVLSMYYRLTAQRGKGPSPDSVAFKIVFGLENIGRGPARDPFLSLSLGPYPISPYGLDGNGNHGLRLLPRSSDSNFNSFGASGDVVLHPRMRHDITVVIVEADSLRFSPPTIGTGEYALAADSFPLTKAAFAIPPEEFLEATVRHGISVAKG